jgi:iron complex transport system substrate-binding protein
MRCDEPDEADDARARYECADEGLAAANGRAALLATPGFGATPAGRAQRVVSLDALFLLGFGPRLPLAVATLHRRLSDALA